MDSIIMLALRGPNAIIRSDAPEHRRVPQHKILQASPFLTVSTDEGTLPIETQQNAKGALPHYPSRGAAPTPDPFPDPAFVSRDA